MAERVTAQKRIKLQNIAEKEITRFEGDHSSWHKNIHNVDLDSVQILKMKEMDQHPNTIDCSCRRTRKTSIKELWFLEYLAKNADQELGIIAPREAQSIVNLNYHLDAIRRSEILNAYLFHKSGRRQMSDTNYQFANRSIARAYGIMSQVDGGDITVASIEEIDDMPKERLTSNFLLMMGATARLGASDDSINEPIIRITGVFKGADTLTDLIDSGMYHLLPTVDVYLGIELGIINENFLLQMRGQLSPDEYIRQLLCKNISSRNLIWESWTRRAMQTGLDARIELASPLPGMVYQKRGMISFGYDHSGHGENPQSSKYGLVVTEQIGNFTCFIFAKSWAPGTDEKIVARDLIGLWMYFNPDYAMGDAFGIGLLTFLCDELFALGLTKIDRRAIGDGDSTASTWPLWPFIPLRFEGMVKHQMAQALRSIFNNSQTAIPYFDDQDMKDPETEDLRNLTRQLTNIKPEVTKTSYSSYKMVNAKLGDDLFDAAMASVWALVTRGAAMVAPVVLTSSRERGAILRPHNRLPA